MKKRATAGPDLQRQTLVESTEVAALVYDISPHPHTDGKYRHNVFCPCRNTQSNLPVEARLEKLLFRAGDIVFGIDIGAAIVNNI